jgi:cold shock CspA family protein
VQATVFEFNEHDRSGTVVLDDGEQIAFGPEAFATSGLRLLRAGQRVRVDVLPNRSVARLTIVTLPDVHR